MPRNQEKKTHRNAHKATVSRTFGHPSLYSYMHSAENFLCLYNQINLFTGYICTPTPNTNSISCATNHHYMLSGSSGMVRSIVSVQYIWFTQPLWWHTMVGCARDQLSLRGSDLFYRAKNDDYVSLLS